MTAFSPDTLRGGAARRPSPPGQHQLEAIAVSIAVDRTPGGLHIAA